MDDENTLLSLDPTSLDAVTGSNGVLLEGEAARQLYDHLADLRNSGHPGVSGTGIVSDGGLHVTLEGRAGVSCESIERAGKMSLKCNVAAD